MDERHKLCVSYCDELLKVAGVFYFETKSAEVDSIRTKLLISRNSIPHEVLERSGCKLWRYREELSNRDEESLLKIGLDEVMDDTDKREATEKGFDVLKVFNDAHMLWEKLSEDGRAEVFRYMNNAVTAYARVLKMDRSKR